jgi:gluconolactonase
MRELPSPARALSSSCVAVVLGLVAACTSSNPEPSPGSGGTGAMGGAAGVGGGNGGTSGKGGGSSGAGGAMGGTAGVGGSVGGKGGQPTAGAGGTPGNFGGFAGTLATGGAGTGGAAGTPGGGTAGDTSGGSAGSSGSGGSAGASGSGGSAGKSAVWQCPPGVTGMPTLGTLTRVAGVPPADDFNMMNGTFGNIEGPVWVEDALYLTEMSVMPYVQQDNEVKMARILKVTPAGQVSIVVADSGSNGLAIDGPGSLLAAVHKDGSIKRFALPGGAATTVTGMYMNARFNSPNDLTVHSATGTLYFTDPEHNAPQVKPQAMARAYRLAPGGMPEPIPSAASPDQLNAPNGITLSPAEDFLYVAAAVGRRYPVLADGTLGAGTDFPAISQMDGMAVDCAGNLYAANPNQPAVVVSTPEGTMIGTITVPEVQSATNIAFGGADHKTLYVTGLGNTKGLFQMTLDIAGRPY